MPIRNPRLLWLSLLAVVCLATVQLLRYLPAQAQSSPAWFDSAWAHRIPITVANPGGALSNQQVRIPLDSSFPFAGAGVNGQDLRVTTDDGQTLLPLWIERWQPSSSATLWARLPSIAAGETQTLYIYYGNSAASSVSNASAVFETYDGFESAISGAPLANATTPQDTPTYDDSGQVVHPDIVYFANGWNGYRYWLVMEPYPFSQDSYENPSILVSNDGASWAPPPGITNPIALPNTSYLADADLVYDQASNQMWMYYPHQTVNGQTRMIRKTSSDGINWGDPYNEPLLFTVPDYQLLSPAVVKVGSTYRMWSVNTGAQGCDGQSNYVQVRTSTNGTSWSAPSNVSLSIPNMLPWHIDVIYVPSKAEYWALVPAYAPGSDCTNTELYFAKSSDGTNWTTYSTPALRKGASWDSGQIYRSTLIYDADTDMLRVWYSANNGSIWRQGYAERKYTDFLQALNGTNTLVLSGSGTWSQSTQQAARGSGSGRFVQNTGSDFSVALKHSSYTGFVQEWEMYDSLDSTATAMVGVQSGQNQVTVGVATNASPNRYVWQNAAGQATGHQRNPHAGLAHLWHPARK